MEIKLHMKEKIHLAYHQVPYLSELDGLHPNITIYHLLSHTFGLFNIYAVPNLQLEVSMLLHENRDFLKYLTNQDNCLPQVNNFVTFKGGVRCQKNILRDLVLSRLY
ncbi:hypothetical protein B5V88_06175 [Heyndrickxia sporothermodurans]|nr:hypothetical protein B5V88_06175 [Heyndrickxia sporothermodurans]PTY85007.1 hypothetical protein B5V91_11500 [Heyndrickxia sporothermodurans]PTY90892.1 hypothetical protein B5V90_05715 [Heyndrickxia sporothermodurans]